MRDTTGLVEEKKSFTFTPPPKVLEHWQKFCTLNGLIQKDAAAAAFRLIQYAPLEVRDLAVKGNDKALKAWFEEAEAAMAESRAGEILDRIAQKLAGSPGGPRPKGSAEIG